MQRKSGNNREPKRLHRRRRRQLEEEMARYVETMAPASGEFVRETSDHVAEVLLRVTEW